MELAGRSQGCFMGAEVMGLLDQPHIRNRLIPLINAQEGLLAYAP